MWISSALTISTYPHRLETSDGSTARVAHSQEPACRIVALSLRVKTGPPERGAVQGFNPPLETCEGKSCQVLPGDSLRTAVRETQPGAQACHRLWGNLTRHQPTAIVNPTMKEPGISQ